MADSRHLEKSENGHIYVTVSPICMKFGTVMHVDRLNRTGS